MYWICRRADDGRATRVMKLSQTDAPNLLMNAWIEIGFQRCGPSVKKRDCAFVRWEEVSIITRSWVGLTTRPILHSGHLVLLLLLAWHILYYVLFCVYIVTWLINTWVSDWKLDFFGHLPLTTLVITIYFMALSPIHPITVYTLSFIHSYDIQSTITHTESSSVVTPVLGYRFPTADVPLPGFPNYPRRIATATLDSVCCH
jgi:hypothetical protein